MFGTANRLKTRVQGNTDFALELYHTVRKTHPANFLFSPVSVSSCLDMVFLGARGDTASQMARCLHLQTSNGNADPGFASLHEKLLAACERDKVELRTANSLWGDRRFPVLPEYLDTLARHYRASFQEVDFSNSTEVCKLINQWVNENTNALIKKIVSEDDIRGALLVLANAIYFKGKWSTPFNQEYTEPCPFVLASGEAVDVSMMMQAAAGWYAKIPGPQILEKSYGDGAYSMVILLPERHDGLAALEATMNPSNLNAWLAKLEPLEEVRIALPKFRTTSRYELNDPLLDMGMVDAFHPDTADFAGMTGKRDFYVGKVIHEALIDVEEEGTKAAAVMTTIMFLGAEIFENIPVFSADHPFVFLIRHKPSGIILFLGRMMDPRPAEP